MSDWKVSRVRSRTINISHPWIANSPACKPEPHPTRDCGCKVFRTEALAQAYVESKR